MCIFLTAKMLVNYQHYFIFVAHSDVVDPCGVIVSCVVLVEARVVLNDMSHVLMPCFRWLGLVATSCQDRDKCMSRMFQVHAKIVIHLS